MPEITPDLVAAFIAFCEESADEFADFELVRNPEQKVRGLVGNEGKAEQFRVIGQHGTASIIAFWRENNELDFLDSPIAWLSSEGFPNSVFANSFAEFLSLLPYGTGFIYDVLSNYYNYKEDPDLQPSPEEKFTPEEVSSYLAENRKRYKGHAEFVRWLQQEAKVEVADDPLFVIKGAIASHADLASWLKAK